MKNFANLVLKNVLIVLIIFTLSCKKEDINSIRNQDFQLNINYFRGDDTTIMYITNDDDEILYDTIGVLNQKVIKIKKKINENINLTIGEVCEGRIVLRTYKDIKSGYKATNLLTCDNAMEKNYSSIGEYEIKIKGVSNYSKIIFPHQFYRSINFNEAEKEIAIKSNIIFNSDIVVTIIPENSNVPLSFYLERDSLKELTPGHFFYSIDYSQFEQSIKHKIDLDKFAKFKYNIVVLNSKGKLVQLASENNDINPLESNEIFFYSVPSLVFSDIRITLPDYNASGPYIYNKYFNEIPTSINLFDPSTDFINTNKEKYEALNNFQYDFSKTTISYDIPNKSYIWEIYEKKNSVFIGDVPKLPNFIKEFLKYNENSTPWYITSRFYKLNNPNFIDSYNQSNSVLYLYCREYEGKEIWKSL